MCRSANHDPHQSRTDEQRSTVRVERKAIFLNDQDTLRKITELGVGVEEIASNDASTHAKVDDDAVVHLGGCLFRSKLELHYLECLLATSAWMACYLQRVGRRNIDSLLRQSG